ncbi:MAG: ATP-binding protein, partial [Lachnospiraceae bacterium]|nr:ATP-binding protein [Lachnospiraceae bacterium]
MVNKFSCHNFRNIQADGLEFEKINLLIGPNNSGKSNFIKALTFFSEMLKNADDGILKSAFLNAVARNGWDHSLCRYVKETEPIEFTWEIMINEEPFEYKLSFGVGKTVEQCNIVLEELNSAKTIEKYEQNFNYFRCHSDKVGKGKVSTAIQRGQKNQRLTFEVDSKETIVMQFKDILLNNTKIYGSERIRVDIAQILYQLQKYFEGFHVYASAQLEMGKMREPAEINSTDEFLNANATN